MPIRGVCKLCLREAELLKSHYIPKALYPTKRQKSATISGSRLHSGRTAQLKDHLLCHDCEQRFEQNGETEVLKWLAPKAKNYSLNDRLRLALPREKHPDVSLYSAYDVGLDAGKFAYFALSLIWRGAVHRWTLLDGTLSIPLNLGEHEETIRQFLVGECTFPHQTVSIVVIVCSDSESRSLWTVPGQDEMDGCENYRFIARGVIFRALIGSDIPEFYRRSSCVAARQWIAYGDLCTSSERGLCLASSGSRRITHLCAGLYDAVLSGL